MKVVTSDEIDSGLIDYAGHMQRAIELAGQVLTTTPNPRVGCVLVDADNRVIGEGWHQTAGQAHAEAMALASCSEQALQDSPIAFVSLEPCSHHGRTPPCSDALIAAGIKTVVIAGMDPNPQVSGQGVAKLEAAGISVFHLKNFENQAELLNRGYLQRRRLGIPFVRCKLAMSLDGRTAMASGESKWITGAAARSDVQTLRASSCAIVTGVDTILADDPSLTVRLESLAVARQPMRVVLDSKLRTPSTARLLQSPGEVKIFTAIATEEGAKDKGKNHPHNVEIISAPAQAPDQQVDLKNVLESLAGNYACNEVLVESGSTLAGAFIQSGLVDELIVYVSGKLLGSDARPLLNLPGLASMSDQIALQITDVAMFDNDIRITATIVK